MFWKEETLEIIFDYLEKDEKYIFREASYI